MFRFPVNAFPLPRQYPSADYPEGYEKLTVKGSAAEFFSEEWNLIKPGTTHNKTLWQLKDP
jgi:hypothetical protein